MRRGVAQILIMMVIAFAQAQIEDRFVQSLILPDGRMVVVAEGEYEPRSIGSYSVRLYSAANPDLPFDDFQTGIVASREGIIERLEAKDLNYDGVAELIVIIRSVGTGGYLSADAFSLSRDEIALFVSVNGLDAKANIIEALEKSLAE